MSVTTAVSRFTPVSGSMRRNGHPSRPSIGPGDHPNFVGRFCRRSPSPRTGRTHPDTDRLQIDASSSQPDGTQHSR